MRLSGSICVLIGIVGLANGCVDTTTCTTIAVASVNVQTIEPNGDTVVGATVTYRVDDGNAQSCETSPDGGYVCGWEQGGTITVAASKPGYEAAEQTVTVRLDEDGCHVQGQSVTLSLPQSPHFADVRVYAHAWYATQQECDQAIRNGINCYQVLELCPDGMATLMLTDILNIGSYQRSGNAIETTWPTPGDTPDSVDFTHDAVNDTLTDQLWIYSWPRDDGSNLIG